MSAVSSWKPVPPCSMIITGITVPEELIILIDPLNNVTAGAGMLRPPHRDKVPEKEKEQLQTFVSSDERAETFGSWWKTNLRSGRRQRTGTQLRAKQLERELHRLKAHTYGLDFKAEGVWGRSAREIVNASGLLAEAGLMSIAVLPGLPVLPRKAKGTYCIWLGDVVSVPETADRILPLRKQTKILRFFWRALSMWNFNFIPFKYLFYHFMKNSASCIRCSSLYWRSPGSSISGILSGSIRTAGSNTLWPFPQRNPCPGVGCQAFQPHGGGMV